MLPDFLANYRSQLEAHALDYVRIQATPLAAGDSLPLTQSKLLGEPYLPLGVPYPLDEAGQPMLLWAQLNFAEIPALPDFPTAGILQFFASATDWYSADDYQVLYHADPTAAPQTDFSFLTPDLYEESPIFTEHALSFSRQVDYGSADDCRFEATFDGQDYDEYRDSLPEAQQEEPDACFYTTGHKLGGYADFTQGDPRSCTAGQPVDVQLLQLDSGEQLMFGDAGLAHLFISPAALRARQFDQAYFYWDCC